MEYYAVYNGLQVRTNEGTLRKDISLDEINTCIQMQNNEDKLTVFRTFDDAAKVALEGISKEHREQYPIFTVTFRGKAREFPYTFNSGEKMAANEILVKGMTVLSASLEHVGLKLDKGRLKPLSEQFKSLGEPSVQRTEKVMQSVDVKKLTSEKAMPRARASNGKGQTPERSRTNAKAIENEIQSSKRTKKAIPKLKKEVRKKLLKQEKFTRQKKTPKYIPVKESFSWLRSVRDFFVRYFHYIKCKLLDVYHKFSRPCFVTSNLNVPHNLTSTHNDKVLGDGLALLFHFASHNQNTTKRFRDASRVEELSSKQRYKK